MALSAAAAASHRVRRDSPLAPRTAATSSKRVVRMPSIVLERDDLNGVVYRTLLPADADAAIPAVAQAFAEGEPTTGAAGATLKDMLAFCKMYVPRMAAEGNTVIAEDMNDGQILGAFLNEDYNSPTPPGFDAFLSKSEGNWMPTLTMIEELEMYLNRTHAIPADPADRPAGRWFHLWMVGVLSTARGRQIGRKLVCHSVAVARSKGFALAFAECTGSVSTHLMRKYANATPAMVIDYATWAGCDGAETLRALPAQGHPGLSLMVCDLVRAPSEKSP